MKTTENTKTNTNNTEIISTDVLKAKLNNNLNTLIDRIGNASGKQALTLSKATSYALQLDKFSEISVDDLMNVTDLNTAVANVNALQNIVDAGEEITKTVKYKHDYSRARALAMVKGYPVHITDKKGTVTTYETFADYWKMLHVPSKQRASELQSVGKFFMAYLPEFTEKAPVSRVLKFMQIVPKLAVIDEEFWRLWNKGHKDNAREYARKELRELDITPDTKEGGLRKDILKKQEKDVKPENTPNSNPENTPEDTSENVEERTPEIVTARPYIDSIELYHKEDYKPNPENPDEPLETFTPYICIEFNEETPEDIINKVLETLKDVYNIV